MFDLNIRIMQTFSNKNILKKKSEKLFHANICVYALCIL
jgi:hypothetical protein